MKIPKILLLTTGGTIAMRAETKNNSGGVLKLGVEELLKSVPQVASIADVDGRNVLSRASSSLTFDDIKLLVNEINSAQEVDGIVITHGTDTLEETAFALQLTTKKNIPVVMTGAMRRADLPGADGPANILDSFRVACSEEAKGKGILIVLNNEIHSAQFVRKTHSFLPNTFQSIGPLGWVAENRVRFFLAPAITYPCLTIGEQQPNVLLVEAGLCFDKSSFKSLHLDSIDGLVLAVTGVGHISSAVVEELESLAAKKPVIFASRTEQGETFQNIYGYPGSESDLIKRGLIPSGFLSARQARIALMLLLSANIKLNGVRKFYEFFSA